MLSGEALGVANLTYGEQEVKVMRSVLTGALGSTIPGCVCLLLLPLPPPTTRRRKC